MLTSNLTWDSHVNLIISKANKLLGLLKRTCPLLKDSKVRRSLYLSLVKSLLCYGTEIWSPGNYTLKTRLERVHRRATRWILMCKPDKIPYRERLIRLNRLPLTYDREIKDLVFLYKFMYGSLDINVSEHVSFVRRHGRTHLSRII